MMINKLIPIHYLSSSIFFLFGWISFYYSGFWSYSLVLFGFVLIPLIEVFLPKQMKFFFLDIDKEKNSFLYDLFLYITVPFQFFSICFFLFVINNFELTTYELVGKIFSMGILCGHAINIAHELGHRSNVFEQFLAKLL